MVRYAYTMQCAQQSTIWNRIIQRYRGMSRDSYGGKIERKDGNVTACKFKLIQCRNYPSNPFIVRLRKKERLKARVEEQLSFSHRGYSSGVMILIAQAQPRLIISTRVL